MAFDPFTPSISLPLSMLRSLRAPLLFLPFLTGTAGALASSDSVAVYDVTFDATWSSATHPGAYPAEAHFSPLIGSTHDAGGFFWQPGGLASPGIERMAELGSTFLLSQEINEAINAGTSGRLILGGGINSPGSTGVSVRVTDDFPLVSLVTMVAPSPDWFVGVHGVALLENGTWVDQKVVQLFAYDAGTDSGPNFNSLDADTQPRETITRITAGPFTGAVPLGTFTFTRVTSTLLYGCGGNPPGSLAVSVLPRLGNTVNLDLHDPTGTMGVPSATRLFLGLQPAPGFPCGVSIPGFGLSGPGASGELLIRSLLGRVSGPAWVASPARVGLPIPNDPTLTGLKLYAQGLLVDGTGRIGVTDASELLVGP